MKSAYLYPISAFINQSSPNEYIESFMDSLEGEIDFLNRNSPSTRGIIDLMHYFRKLDMVFLNWIEDLPDKRGGIIQSLFFICMIPLLRLRKTSIIYVLHNKQSHYDTNRFLKQLIFRLVIKNSTLIVTHSKEGLRYLDQLGIDSNSRAKYTAHPLVKKRLPSRVDQTTDILIWGSIIPYKGADKFLAFLHEKNLEKRYRILLAGKVKPAGYEKTIQAYCNDFIRLENRFIPDAELEEFMASTRSVLFTYVGASVLSSGALMDSLSYGLRVLAPHIGAFRDLQEEGLIQTFSDYEDLAGKLDDFIHSTEDIGDRIDLFIKENDWTQFSKKMISWINK